MPRNPTFPDCFDEVKNIDMAWLKRLGYLRPDAVVSGPLRWTCGGKPSGSITIKVSLLDRFVELDYLCNGKPINYRVRLEAIKTHFGNGFNWYFICPATRRRCKKLYGIGEYFLSRFAYPSAMYSSQTESKRTRELLKAFRTLDLREKFLNERYARPIYKGKPTKRFRRILHRERRHDRSDALRRFLDR